MESCRLPIDVCELIMDSVKEELLGHRCSEENMHALNKTLRSCALTCRAWRPRALYHLWDHIKLLGPVPMEFFLEAFRHAHITTTSHMRYLLLNCCERTPIPIGDPHLVVDVQSIQGLRLNELFLTHKARNLRTLVLIFPSGETRFPVYSRVLRTRPPLLARITTLELRRIIPSCARMVLDFMWTCPDLSSFTIHFITDGREHPETDTEFQHLGWTSKPSGACRKLTKVVIDFEYMRLGWTWRNPTWLYPPLSALFRNRTMFGSHIQYISLSGNAHELREYTHFLANSNFPALEGLRILHKRAIPFKLREASVPSVARALAERIIFAQMNLKTVVIADKIIGHDGSYYQWHKGRTARCGYCWPMIGIDANWDLPLRKRFGRPDPALFFRVPTRHCAAHIVRTLPHLRSILVITCPSEEDTIRGENVQVWVPYEVPSNPDD